MPIKPLILFPFNGNARESLAVINSINSLQATWDPLGFIDDDESKKGLEFGGIKVLGNKSLIKNYPRASIIAVPGRPENFQKRKTLIENLDIPDQAFATLIDPSVKIGPECKIGKNCLIMANVVLTGAVTIGDHVVILPNTVVSHESKIGSYTLLGSNISISGGVTVGELCYIGSGSKIIQEITIAKNTLIGLGTVVLKSTQPGDVVVGNPGHVLPQKRTN